MSINHDNAAMHSHDHLLRLLWDGMPYGTALGFKKGADEKQVFEKKGVSIMDILNFVIAIVALVMAVMVFQRTGGIKDLRKTTAELLAKMEKRMREEEAAKEEKEKTQQ